MALKFFKPPEIETVLKPVLISEVLKQINGIIRRGGYFCSECQKVNLHKINKIAINNQF